MSMKILIVVDMLNDFIDEKGNLYCGQQARDIIPFIKSRIELTKSCGVADKGRVIYLQDSHKEDDKEFERFPAHAIAGTWGSKIIPELKPAKIGPEQISLVKIIEKTRYSGFYRTTLGSLLSFFGVQYGIENIEVVGVCTSICVMDTVGGLANRNYNIIVPRAGVADFDLEAHEFALKRMENLYGAEIAYDY